MKPFILVAIIFALFIGIFRLSVGSEVDTMALCGDVRRLQAQPDFPSKDRFNRFMEENGDQEWVTRCLA